MVKSTMAGIDEWQGWEKVLRGAHKTVFVDL